MLSEFFRRGYLIRVIKVAGKRVNGITADESGEASVLRVRLIGSFPFFRLLMLTAMCLRVTKFSGPLSVRMRHWSSLKVVSLTQWRLW